jgi:hypothetical protein
MSLPDTEWLERLKNVWSCEKRCKQVEMVDNSAAILQQMGYNGIKRFATWWLSRFHDLPAQPELIERMLFRLIKLWLPPHLDSLRLVLKTRRYELVVKQMNFRPPAEKQRLQTLEAILTRVLLTNWHAP